MTHVHVVLGDYIPAILRARVSPSTEGWGPRIDTGSVSSRGARVVVGVRGASLFPGGAAAIVMVCLATGSERAGFAPPPGRGKSKIQIQI